MANKFCVRCGTPLAENAGFCASCGAAQQAQRAPAPQPEAQSWQQPAPQPEAQPWQQPEAQSWQQQPAPQPEAQPWQQPEAQPWQQQPAPQPVQQPEPQSWQPQPAPQPEAQPWQQQPAPQPEAQPWQQQPAPQPETQPWQQQPAQQPAQPPEAQPWQPQPAPQPEAQSWQAQPAQQPDAQPWQQQPAPQPLQQPETQPWQQSQPGYQQPYGGQPPHPGKPAKKRRIPIWLKILIGLVAAGIVTMVVLFVFVLPGILSNAAKLDYYEIADDLVPTVKLALGEERKVIGTTTSANNNGVRTKVYDYAGTDDTKGDMLEYSTYLRNYDDFVLIVDADFTRSSGEAIQLARSSVTSGYIVIVQLDYDEWNYSVTVMWGEGKVTPFEKPEGIEPTIEPTIEPVIGGEIQDPMWYMVNGEYVPSISSVLGGTREVVDSTSDSSYDYSTIKVQYNIPGYEQGLELNEYRLNLEAYESFILVTDANFGDAYGYDIRLARNALTDGYIVLIQLDWDTSGYTITTTYLEGTLTVNEPVDPDPTGGLGTGGIADHMVSGSLFAWISNGRFYFEYENIDINGDTEEGGIGMRDGVLVMLGESEGSLVRVVQTDDVAYLINDDVQMVVISDPMGDIYELFLTVFQIRSVEDSGTGTFDGKTMSYVDFYSEGDYGLNTCWFDGEDIYAIDDMYSITYIRNATNNPSADMFEIPDNYMVYDSREG